MIRPLTDQERTVWNLEQPGARVTTDLTSENQAQRKHRVWAVAERVHVAQYRAEQKRKGHAA